MNDQSLAAPAETVNTPAPAAAVPSGTDRDNRPFDPAKFKPEKDRNGRWVRLHPGKVGRPRKVVQAPAAPAAPKVERAAPDFSDIERAAGGGGGGVTGEPAGELATLPARVPDKYEQAAIGTVSGVSTIGILVMGAHTAPKPDQIAAMVQAYAEMYRHYGYAPEPPPWLAPAIVTATWIGPHLADQRTQTNLQTWKGRLVGWWVRIRGWAGGRRDSRAAANVAATAAGAP